MDHEPVSTPRDPKEFRRWIKSKRLRRALKATPVIGVTIWRIIVGDGVTSFALILGILVGLFAIWITSRRWAKRKGTPGMLASSYATFVPRESTLHDRGKERGIMRSTTPVVGWIWLDRQFLRWEPRWRARRRGYRTIMIPVGDITHAWVHTTEEDSGHLRTRLSVKLRDGRSGPFVLSGADEPDVEEGLRIAGVDVRG